MNNTREIVVLQMFGFLTFAIGHSAQQGTGSFQIPEPKSLLGWALLTVILLGFNDVNATSELALAMAYLIFVSVMLYYGGDLFDKLTKQVGGSTDTSTTTITTGRYAGKPIPQ